MQRVNRKVSDPVVRRLIWRFLRAGVMENGRLRPSEQGVPQGGPLSPLLANIVLHDLDMELEKRGHKFVRYADDFLVLVKSERSGQRVMASLVRFLEKKLRLAVNPGKSKVAKLNQCQFLGFTVRGKKIVWSDKSLAQFKRRVKELTGRSWGVSMDHRMRKLSEYLRGWMAYFALSEYYRPLPELDEWIRRRMRMCYWKQWRTCRKRVRELIKLGVSESQAVLTALSRKSYPASLRSFAVAGWHLLASAKPAGQRRIQDDGDPKRHDQRMAGITRTCLGALPVDSVPLSGNKSVRMTAQDAGNSSEPPDAEPRVRWCGNRS